MTLIKKVPEYKSRDFLVIGHVRYEGHIRCVTTSFYFFNGSANLAAKNCLFILAMLVTEMPFGHSAIHAYVFKQLPNPSSSILATIFCTLS